MPSKKRRLPSLLAYDCHPRCATTLQKGGYMCNTCMLRHLLTSTTDYSAEAIAAQDDKRPVRTVYFSRKWTKTPFRKVMRSLHFAYERAFPRFCLKAHTLKTKTGRCRQLRTMASKFGPTVVEKPSGTHTGVDTLYRHLLAPLLCDAAASA